MGSALEELNVVCFSQRSYLVESLPCFTSVDEKTMEAGKGQVTC